MEPSPQPTTAFPEIQQRDRVISFKRPHSDTQDAYEESSTKIARTNNRGPRVTQDDDDYDRPQSSGYDASRRRSFDDGRDDRESSRPRYEEGRGRGRGNSRDREMSPGRKAFESRPPARSRVHEAGDDFHMRDRDDWEENRDRDRRPFEVRGGYRGRAFDPNYRGRGRGRGGRGDYQSQTESRSDPGAFGAKLANGQPWKDTRGFDRGGKGGQ